MAKDATFLLNHICMPSYSWKEADHIIKALFGRVFVRGSSPA
jgi:hypothetical protein